MGVNAAGLSDGEHSDTLAAYSSACAFFGERLSAVTGSDWDRPTPCDDWDVQTLVAHVVTGEALVARLLREGGSWDTEVDPSILGLDPMAAWRGTALAALNAASADGVLDALHPHSLGDLPGGVVVGFRVTENLEHGWHRARAGADHGEVRRDAVAVLGARERAVPGVAWRKRGPASRSAC